MKNSLFILLVVVTIFSKAQNIACYNGGEISLSEIKIKENAFNGERPTSLILMPYVMKQEDVLPILKEKNSPAVNKFLKMRALSNGLRPIGFLSIPSCALGALSLVSINASDNNSIHSPQQKLGVGFLALGAICVCTSVYFNAVKNKNYKKAIAKYNQLYN